MNLHEYQAKTLFTNHGIAVPSGKPAYSVKEALRHAADLGGNSWVVKAQVHAGGRGKAGGVKLVHNTDELENATKEMLGSQLITKQSAPKGQPINCVLIQEICEIEREFYLGMVVDRSQRKIAIMVSGEGGMDIEEIAATQPEKIHTLTTEPIFGIQNYQCQKISYLLGFNANQQKQLADLLHKLYRLFITYDLSLIEINPLILSKSGQLQALDAKLSIDDNALFRQADIKEWRDPSQEDEKENIAKRYDLNYVTLDGNIACMVNGAGLAMATMDIIKLHGGNPANFLDVGGNTNTEKVSEAFKLIISDSNVKAILINIFGGIVRCDLIAEGIIQAATETNINIPIVVRLEGTNVNQGKKILADSNLTIISADNLSEAAEKVVQIAK